MSYYVSQSIVFEDNQIYYTQDGQNVEVMMDWEQSIMSASAAYVCEGGGDILEVGFGMGISAGYIQSHSINSHTICENHPDIIPKALSWAADKPNVTIVTSSWYEVKDTLSTYDGIFYDTFGDDNWHEFGIEVSSLTKQGANVTWWNNEPSENNLHGIEGVTYNAINVNPPSNTYFNSTTYYLPKKEF